MPTKSIEEVKELIKDMPYTILEDTYTTVKNGFTAITDDGYKVFVCGSSFYRKIIPEIFGKGNPYTIENIKQYIEKNNINAELISNEYVNSKTKMEWKCSCGNIFYTNWNSFLNGKHMCNKCSNEKVRHNSRLDFNKVCDDLHSIGFKILYIDRDNAIYKSKIDVEDRNGYRYNINYWEVINGKMPHKFHVSNKYTIFNINRYLNESGRGDYKCIERQFNGNNFPMKIFHLPCGTIFKSTLVELQGRLFKSDDHIYFKKCPTCENKRIESVHASVLKQVFVHEYPETVLEDKSCINPLTGYILPTDIVNHTMKIVVEVQSHYHDDNYQKEKDEIKKNFWIEHGYKYFSPDIRDYSVVGLLQLFFPKISEIPSYVNYNFSNCTDFRLIQDSLNEGMSKDEISKKYNIKLSTINGAIYNKRVILPDGYKEKFLNIRKIVQLSKEGNYINTYSSISDAQKAGHQPSSICLALHNKIKFHHNCIWLYESDYLSGNYTIP